MDIRKVKVLIGFLLLFSPMGLFGQQVLDFEILPGLPVGTVAFAYANSQDNLYAIGGETSNKPYTSNLQVYDDKIQKWLKFRLKTLPRQSYSSAVYVEDYKGIVITGGIQQKGNSGVLINEIKIIYSKDLKIDVLGPIPTPAKSIGIAENNNIIYLFGGSTSKRTSAMGPINYTFSEKFYAYDLTNGSLSEHPDLPVAMETKGGIINDRLYVFGGFDGKSLSAVWQYEINKKVWTALDKLDVPVSANALVQYEEYFILVGDYVKGSQLILYDTKNNKTVYFDTNVQAKNIGAAVIGDYLHVYGGGVLHRGFSENSFIEFSNRGVSESTSHYRISLSELINASN